MHLLPVGCVVAHVHRSLPCCSPWAVRVLYSWFLLSGTYLKVVMTVQGGCTVYLYLQIISALIWRHHPGHRFNLYGVDFLLCSIPVLSPLPRALGSREQRGHPGLPSWRWAAPHEHVQAMHGGEFLRGCRGVQDLLTVTSEVPGEAG